MPRAFGGPLDGQSIDSQWPIYYAEQPHPTRPGEYLRTAYNRHEIAYGDRRGFFYYVHQDAPMPTEREVARAIWGIHT